MKSEAASMCSSLKRRGRLWRGHRKALTARVGAECISILSWNAAGRRIRCRGEGQAREKCIFNMIWLLRKCISSWRPKESVAPVPLSTALTCRLLGKFALLGSVQANWVLLSVISSTSAGMAGQDCGKFCCSQSGQCVGPFW